MTKFYLIGKCCEIIEAHEEDDFECYGVRYSLFYKDGKIQFSRTTIYPNGETYSDGGIDTNSYESVLFEEESSIEDYCNIAVALANGSESLKYEYGSDVECIQLRYVLD